MKTVEDCMRGAWQALLRGDLAERDRLVGLARNLMNAHERVSTGGPIVEGEAIEVGGAIALPDRSRERLQ